MSLSATMPSKGNHSVPSEGIVADRDIALPLWNYIQNTHTSPKATSLYIVTVSSELAVCLSALDATPVVPSAYSILSPSMSPLHRTAAHSTILRHRLLFLLYKAAETVAARLWLLTCLPSALCILYEHIQLICCSASLRMLSKSRDFSLCHSVWRQNLLQARVY